MVLTIRSTPSSLVSGDAGVFVVVGLEDKGPSLISHLLLSLDVSSGVVEHQTTAPAAA